jgi:hypothetical protein
MSISFLPTSLKTAVVDHSNVSASYRFVLLQVDLRTERPIPAAPETLWEVEVKTASPVRNTQETPLSQYIDAVLEVQVLLKGLLDLRRQDV